jgi:hypothetical protein
MCTRTYLSQTRIHSTTARTTVPILVVRVPLERLIAAWAREPRAREEDAEIRGGGSGGVVAHSCLCVVLVCRVGVCCYVR